MRTPGRPWVAPLGPRSPEEEHRASTPLELFFDLVIVVAVAQASGLHHALREGRVGAGVLAFPEAITSPGTESWERFRFAVPGETTIADAIRHLGKPEIRASTSVVDAEIDVIGPPWTSLSYLRDTYRRAQDRGVPVIKVELLQWLRTDPARHGLGLSFSTLVFRGDRLWYAITPPSPDEATPAQLAHRHSQPAQSLTVTRLVGDLGHRVKVLAFPAQGVAYTLHREQVDARLVFPPADVVRFTSDEQPDEEPSPK